MIQVGLNAQTTIWSADCENLAGWGFQDLDGDGSNFFNYSDGTYVGFDPGQYLGSLSQALTPDNLVISPDINIPAGTENMEFSLKVASSSDTDYSETFGVYVQEVGVEGPTDNLIYQQTLTNGGAGSYSTITASVPDSYAGKTVRMVVRHFNTNDQFFFMIDDFNLVGNDALSDEDFNLTDFKLYPNPVRDRLTIQTNMSLSSVEVFNLLGQKVIGINAESLFDNTIDVSTLSNGYYLLKVKSGNQSSLKKFIKE